MEKSEYHCLNRLSGPVFQNCQQNEGSKHRKVATYGTNQAEGVQEVRWTLSPQQRQTRLRTVRPQCASGEPQIRRNQSQPRQESRAESAQPPQHCPRAVSDSAGHRSRTQGLGQWASQSVLEFQVDPMRRKRERWNQPRGVLRFLIYSDGVVQEAVYTTMGPAYVMLM